MTVSGLWPRVHGTVIPSTARDGCLRSLAAGPRHSDTEQNVVFFAGRVRGYGLVSAEFLCLCAMYVMTPAHTVAAGSIWPRSMASRY